MELEMMLDPSRPVPWQWLDSDLRQVAVALLILEKRAVAFVQPVNDPTQMTWLPPQGGCLVGESVFGTARREVREELPSLRRPHDRSWYRVQWSQAQYLGSADNQSPRSGKPNRLHCVAFPVVSAHLRVNPNECRDATWAFDPEVAQTLLTATATSNPVKFEIIRAAVREAMRRQLLL